MFSKSKKPSASAGNSTPKAGYKRKAEPRKKSEREFSETAATTHKKNIQSGPMRGGIRL